MMGRPFSRDRRGWRVGLLALANSVETGLRNLVTNVFPALQPAFAITLEQLGLLSGLVRLARVVMGPVWGVLADRFGRRRLLVVVTLCWGAWFAALSRVATYGEFLFFYAVGVLGLVAVEPVAVAIVSDLYAQRERGRAFGWLRAFGSLGTVAVTPLVGALASQPEGWRRAFLLMGVLHVLTGLALWRWLTPRPPPAAAVPRAWPTPPSSPPAPVVAPAAPPPPSAAPAASAAPIAAAPTFAWQAVPRLFALRSMWLLAGTYILATSLVFTSFLPSYLVHVHGLEVWEAALGLAVFQLGAVPGALLGGRWGDAAERWRPGTGRIVLMQAYLVGFALMCVWFLRGPGGREWPVWLGVFLLGLVFPIGFTGSVWPMVSSVVPARWRSTAFGTLGSIQGAVLAAVSYWVGTQADAHGLPTVLFWAVPMPYLANALLWFAFYRCYPAEAEAAAHRDAAEASP